MKKIFLALIALISCMSMNAQIMKVMKGDKIIATYKASEADRFVYEEEPPFGEGTAPANINGKSTNVKWVQLWENGPKFAEYNVGVTDGKAESYGGYYEWVNSDVATANWGSNWRTPNKGEFDALLANCDIEHTSLNGVKGIKVTGKGEYSDNSIFLPKAGYSRGKIFDVDFIGYYWCSTPTDDSQAYYLYFQNSIRTSVGKCSSEYSVRAVLNEEEPDDAPTGFGKGSTNGTIDGKNVNIPWTQLWENGPKFANYNIGVTDGKAESFGEFCVPYGYTSEDDDPATRIWGSDWRMPTLEEFRALRANCESEWTTINGVPGRKYTGRGKYSDNSIFLPAAGIETGGGDVFCVGEDGFYWSSTLEYHDDWVYAYVLEFDSDSQTEEMVWHVASYYSIRAVVKEQ